MRSSWLGPIPVPLRLGGHLLAAGRALADRLGPWPWWWLAGALAGVVPLLAGVVLGTSRHAVATGLASASLLLAAASRDWPLRGMGAIGMAFLAHCTGAVALAYHYPESAAAAMPGGEAFWQRSHDWITTGLCDEYDLSYWVPGHAQLVAAVITLDYVSLGLIPLWQGVYEVDLMNYYVGRLLAHADRPGLALLLGWHPWSVCRGVGYVLLIYEVASLSLSRLAGVSLSSGRARWWRWGLALGFLALDGVIKWTCLEAVRRVLLSCLG